MKLRINTSVVIRNDLIEARYNGFPARKTHLKNKGKTGIIKEIDEIKINDEDTIEIYKLNIDDNWYSELMFSNDFKKLKLSLEFIDDNIVITDRIKNKLILHKDKIKLFDLLFKSFKNEEEFLIIENDIGNLYMNKDIDIELFTDFKDKPILIYDDDISLIKKFINKIKKELK